VRLLCRHPTGLAEIFSVGFKPYFAIKVALIISVSGVVEIHSGRSHNVLLI